MRSYFRRDLNPKFTRFSYPVKAFVDFDAKTAEDALSLSYCRYGYNVKIDGGRIKQGEGIDYARYNGVLFPSSVILGSRMLNAAVFRHYDYENKCRDDILIVQLLNKKVYSLRFSTMKYVDMGIKLTTDKVSFINFHTTNKDMILIIADQAQAYMYDGKAVTTFTAPAAVGCSVHGARVFSVNSETNRLSYSKPLEPMNWTVSASAGGNIDFADEGGALTGLISWKNALYIFREFAVHKLTGYVDQSDFVLTKVFSMSSKIYFPTVAVCNDKMIFLTDDGFYFFDGFAAKRALDGLVPLIGDKSTAHAVFFDNKYRIAVDLIRDEFVVGDEGKEELVRNGIISYDVITGETGIFRGTDVSKFVPFYMDGNVMLLTLFGSAYRGLSVGCFDDSGKLLGTPLKKVWRSPKTDLGSPEKIKVLKKFFVRSESDVTITVRLDKDYPIALTGGTEAKMIPVNRRAERVGFKVETEEDKLCINGLSFEFDFVRRPADERAD